MRRLWIAGLFMLIGAGAGLWFAEDNLPLAAGMGAVVGLMCAVIVFAFPRDNDYPPDGDGLLGR
ncbi:MAG TPA: hypothetical protein VFI93_02605 [Rhizomicrobium sp.]|jgi:hypothetical protein|nr:hypothetical protein [Rhizomicrobium sp.]